jgi:hypothetical protein
MQTGFRRSRSLVLGIVLLALAALLAGCGGGGGGSALPFTAPPAPVKGVTPTQPFYVDTLNYFPLYTAGTAPFSFDAQLASGHYPVPMAYLAEAPGPAGFDVKTESEVALRLWNQADPRIAIVSGVAGGHEMVIVDLVESITYNGINNILGLTEMYGGPYFRVRIAVIDPITHEPMPANELQKTLAHELGHVFGLGHAPDPRDLMHYRANALQGQIPRYFVTYGDAMAVWSTLNYRRVNYVPRDAVTQALQAFTEPTAESTRGAGTVVCVYTKE